MCRRRRVRSAEAIRLAGQYWSVGEWSTPTRNADLARFECRFGRLAIRALRVPKSATRALFRVARTGRGSRLGIR